MKKGLAGALARARRLTAKRRSEIAKHARATQLGKVKPPKEKRIRVRAKGFKFTPEAAKLIGEMPNE